MDLVHLPLKTSKQRGDECHMIGKGVYVHADEPWLAKKVVSLCSNIKKWIHASLVIIKILVSNYQHKIRR